MKPREIWTGVLLVWLIGGVVVGGLSYSYELPTLLLVFFGWARFLEANAPRMTFDWIAVALGGCAMVLFVVLGHFTLRGMAVRRETTLIAPSGPVHWKWRWTLAILAVVLLMFVAGTSLVGLAHQAVWLATSPEPVYDEVLGGWYGAANLRGYENKLKMIGFGFDNYRAATRDALPEAAGRPQAGLNSWETQIVPYLNYAMDRIDFDKPWNDPVNAATFRKPIPDFLNAGYPADTWRNEEGYALSHYAANERVIGPEGVSSFDQISDGASNTVLMGEVDVNFEPWGKPGNWRDPALGLNRSPDGFGCRRAAKVVYFVMADGSVRHFREDTDPAVLQALATPAAGDE